MEKQLTSLAKADSWQQNGTAVVFANIILYQDFNEIARNAGVYSRLYSAMSRFSAVPAMLKKLYILTMLKTKGNNFNIGL